MEAFFGMPKREVLHKAEHSLSETTALQQISSSNWSGFSNAPWRHGSIMNLRQRYDDTNGTGPRAKHGEKSKRT
jgi:hypothetical protein